MCNCKCSNEVEKIRVKYFGDVMRLEQISVGDWIDLRAAQDVELKAGESMLIPLGVAMELPQGYEALLAPRSGTFKKYHVIQTNSPGVIDESFCGDDDQWRMPVLAMADTKIAKNERIAQFRIIKHQPCIAFEEVEHLGNANRGGFGSTGTV